MRINVEVLKNILELTEEKFSECKEMFKALQELKEDKNFSAYELARTYDDAVKGKKLLFHERKYTRFIKKYYVILNMLVSDNKSCLLESFIGIVNLDFDYVKPIYENKDEIIKRLNKLLELNILEFKALTEDECFYDAEYNFSDERELFFEIDNDGDKKGLFTDGNITFKDDSGYILDCMIKYHDAIHDIYPVEVENANYVLRWKISKRLFSEKYDCSANMKVKNLMFDINSLPTYEELQKGDFPKDVADYIAGKEDIATQKKTVVDTVYNVGDMSDTIKRLLSSFEYYTEKCELTKDFEEARAIKAKLDIIKELYTDTIALEEAVTNECFESELMDEEELGEALKKKRWDSIDSHCCSCC